MGNPDHLKELVKGVRHWNAWRAAQGPEFRPDFSDTDIRQAFIDAGAAGPEDRTPLFGANLRLADLGGADLRLADLGGADLRGADLGGANLGRANLEEADLEEANLRRADLREADLRRADLRRADLREADLRRADLREADLRRADLRRADLEGADLEGANLREADLDGANVRSRVLSSGVHTNDRGTPEDMIYRTDLSGARLLTQDHLNSMLGDNETIIPKGLARPDHWPPVDAPNKDQTESGSEPKPQSPVAFTPPVEFASLGSQIDIRHTPTRSEARQSSATPIDEARNGIVRDGLREGFGALAKNLRKYAKEDREVSNRVAPAEALLGYVEALQKTLRVNPFLPALFQDYVEIIALGFTEDIHAFEAADRIGVDRLVKRSRDHYAAYPELPEINDPAHTERIGPDFPYTVASFEAVLDDIAFSPEGLAVFTDQTRDAVQAEMDAYPPANADPDKSKLAKYGAVVGEMWREMSRQAERMRKAAEKGASHAIAWVKSFEKVRKAWEAIEPYLGNGSGGS
ncbi:MAG: pentapeptide repeat-containing protein [Pseudomonadota bacterium]